ncbi:MAG: GNAT family N-acetyltransferase [Bacilli bacterium]|nr:GNAT family N-acetyltransferase [Bacilli bacterium]
MEKISVIVPCYNEQEALPIFYEEITKVAKQMKKVTFEFLFINDGSKDATLEILRNLSTSDDRVRYVSFSRNFGKEAAMYAGLEQATGDYVVLMDADLQDPPALLPKMYDAIVEEGYDSVATRRVSRVGEPPIRSFFARMFYKIINKISNADIVDGARDYRLMTRQMVDAILSMGEYNRFSKGIFGWVGFQTKWLAYENVERVAGETKWNFWKLFLYSLEGIVAFSTVPLTIASLFGILFCVIAFILIMIIVVRTLLFGDPTSGWPSLACILFLVSGIQLFCMGIIGQYLSKTYLETKKRPIYITKETEQTRKRKGSPDQIQIYNLKDKKEYLEEVTKLEYNEWACNKDHNRCERLKIKREKIISQFNDKYFCKLILLENTNLIGFVSLFPSDCKECPELSPWYATMYVKKVYRGKGYSKILNDAILNEAKKRKIKTLYLKTELKNYYEKFGAKYVKMIDENEKIYKFDL